MKFLFREEETKYWKVKENIVRAYFELCKVQFREPFFRADRPITKGDFDLAVWNLEEVNLL